MPGSIRRIVRRKLGLKPEPDEGRVRHCCHRGSRARPPVREIWDCDRKWVPV